MSVKETIKNNWVLRNLLRALIYIVSLYVVLQIAMLVLTQHHIRVKVPDFSGKTFVESQLAAKKAGLQVQVVDSVYVSRMRKGAVYAQNPHPGTKVKRGRRVYLTTNAMRAKQIPMPNLVGCSLRQAKAEIAARGLVLGQLIYTKDIATNNVLGQQIAGKPVAAGTNVDSGSVIDLEIGLNPADGYTYVPDLVGLKNRTAVSTVQDHSLNVQKLIFDSSVKSYTDSLNAMVYRQLPAPSQVNRIRMGSTVKLYLTTTASKIPPKDVPEAAEQSTN